MPKVKARDKGEGIKKLDSALAAGDRMEKTFARTKDTAENLTENKSASPNEYAGDKVQYAAEDISRDVTRLMVNQGKKLAHKGREALLERRKEEERFNEIREIEIEREAETIPHEDRESPKTYEAQPQHHGGGDAKGPSAPYPEETPRVSQTEPAYRPKESLPRQRMTQPQKQQLERVGQKREGRPSALRPASSKTRHEGPVPDSREQVWTQQQKAFAIRKRQAPISQRVIGTPQPHSAHPGQEVSSQFSYDRSAAISHWHNYGSVESRPSLQTGPTIKIKPESPAIRQSGLLPISSHGRAEERVVGTVSQANNPLKVRTRTEIIKGKPQSHRLLTTQEYELPAISVSQTSAVERRLPKTLQRTIGRPQPEARQEDVTPAKGLAHSRMAAKEAKLPKQNIEINDTSRSNGSKGGNADRLPPHSKSTSGLVEKAHQFEVPSTTPEIKVPAGKAPGKAETIRVVNEPRYQYRIVKQPGQSLKKSIRGTDGISTKASRLGIKAPQKAVKTAEQTSRTTVKTAKATAKAAQRSAQASARAVRVSAQAAKASAKAATVTAKATVKAIAAVIKAIATATKDLIAAIAAGGWIALVAIVLICLIGLIVASPFGIFFAGNNRDAGAVTVSAAVSQVNYDFNAQLEALQDDDYDSIDITGTMANWPEVLAVFAVKVAGNEDADAMDVATLDPERVGKLKEVFWDMNTITSEVETIEYPDSNPDDDADNSWTERNLHITISAKTAEEMKTEYNFSEKQKKMLDELLQNRDALLELIGNLEFISADAEEILKNLPDDLSDERREVVKTACSLVGKIGYFWGGKSLVIGWDQRWGTIQKVWAEGSSTTGTYRPYGLDCSGFVDWVFYNMSNGEYVIGHGGGAMSQHTYCTPITWDKAIPGDLVFYPEDSHVGIVGGWDQDGNMLIIHCTSGGSLNGTVITGAYGFSAIGRPRYYTD